MALFVVLLSIAIGGRVSSQELSVSEKLQNELTEKIEDAFNYVIKTKNQEYRDNPGAIPTIDQVPGLIAKAANVNSIISGGASLVPGPFGMLAIVPELAAVIKNQIELIYDITRAYGQKESADPSLLLGIFVQAMGTSAGTLIVLHGGKYVVRRASLSVLQKLITILGGKITQQALKSAVSKWLPVVGAAAMAAWTNYMTRSIGNKAVEIMKVGVVIDNPDTIDVDVDTEVEAGTATAHDAESADSVEFYKLQILIGLAKIDGHVSDDEASYLENALESSSLTATQKLRLTAQLGGSATTATGLDMLANVPEEAILLLSALTALAKRDGEFHVAERMYIKQVGKHLGFSSSDIDEVLASP